MIKSWYLGPVLVAAALVASTLWWQAEKDRWTHPQALSPDLPKVDAMPTPKRVRAKQALERPLFWASRRPVDVEDKKGGLARELRQSRLTAVLESGRERVAILQRTDGSTLKITAETKPWRIESFDGRKAIFISADDGRVERPLEAGAPVPPKAGNAIDRVRKPAPNR